MVRLAFHRGALALALFALGGQALGIAHQMIVPHAVCAAHGELIHVDGARAANTRAAREATRDVYRGVADAGQESSDTHEHCTVSALRRDRVAIASAQPVAVPRAEVCAPILDDREVAPRRSVALLLLAPKSSPPHALA